MKKWITQKLNKDNALSVSQRYDLPMLIAMLLDIRGITEERLMEKTFENANRLFRIEAEG